MIPTLIYVKLLTGLFALKILIFRQVKIDVIQTPKSIVNFNSRRQELSMQQCSLMSSHLSCQVFCCLLFLFFFTETRNARCKS